MSIKITCDNERGIQDYGDPVTCLYGSKITVRDSSSAERIACWLNVDDRSWFRGHHEMQECMSAHLDIEAAKAVIERLQTWVGKAETGDTPFGGLAKRDP